MARNYIDADHNGKKYKSRVRNKSKAYFDLIETLDIPADIPATATRLTYYTEYGPNDNSSKTIIKVTTFDNVSFNPDNILANRAAFEKYIKICSYKSYTVRDGLDIEHQMLTEVIPSWLNS